MSGEHIFALYFKDNCSMYVYVCTCYINLTFKNYQGIFLISLFRECSLNIDSQQVSCSTNTNKKVAKKEAATIALEKLQKRCYTVKVKKNKHIFI